MKKAYLLLRKNHEYGPYTIDELFQQIKPGDLVWIEGKSTSWTLLSDLELQLPAPESESKPAAHKTIAPVETIASAPVTESPFQSIEEKSEALKQKSLAASVVNNKSNISIPSSGFDRDNDSIDFIDHRKDRISTSYEVVAAALVTLFVGLSIVGGRSIFPEKKDLVNSVATQIITDDDHKAKKIIQPAQPVVPMVAHDSTDTVAIVKTPVIRKKIDSTQSKKTMAVTITDSLPKADVAIPPAKKDTETHKIEAQPAVISDVKKDSGSEKPKEVIEQEPVEKKKSLGQAIKGLFRKKKKE